MKTCPATLTEDLEHAVAPETLGDRVGVRVVIGADDWDTKLGRDEGLLRRDEGQI